MFASSKNFCCLELKGKKNSTYKIEVWTLAIWEIVKFGKELALKKTNEFFHIYQRVSSSKKNSLLIELRHLFYPSIELIDQKFFSLFLTFQVVSQFLQCEYFPYCLRSSSLTVISVSSAALDRFWKWRIF